MVGWSYTSDWIKKEKKMIYKLHVEEGVKLDFIVYDKNEKSSTISARILNLMGENASKYDIFLKKVYIPSEISIDTREELCGQQYEVYHDICLIQCHELDHDGYLLKYYKEGLGGELPKDKCFIIVGLSKKEEVILGAV